MSIADTYCHLMKKEKSLRSLLNELESKYPPDLHETIEIRDWAHNVGDEIDNLLCEELKEVSLSIDNQNISIDKAKNLILRIKCLTDQNV